MANFINWLKRFILVTANQYAAIGGQAVIEGVMMRSPNAFVVAVRKSDGTIRVRKDQWYGLSQRFHFLKKPFLRGVLTLVEAMANGIVSLNYSANIAMDEEERQKAMKKGQSVEDFEKKQKEKEKVSWGTYLTMAVSFAFGIGLFVFLPHAITAGMAKVLGQTWTLDSVQFHAVDGIVKACIFISYIALIGLMPDVKRVFQYHGAEHKSISTFEAELPLTVENARKFPTQHPRCGTSFIFFLLFISIIIFSVIFAVFPVGKGQPELIRHLMALVAKVGLTLPIAGVSYEVIKLFGKYKENGLCQLASKPGMWMQNLTTREPDDSQLEVALVSIKAVLELEKKFNLKEQNKKVVTLQETEIKSISEIEDSNASLREFLEA